jgi:hypothetical protein
MLRRSSEPQSQPGQSPVEHAPGEAETQPVGSTAAIDPGVEVGGPAVVGPLKGDQSAATAQPGATIQPGVARQEPAGAVSDQEAEKERIAREEAAKGTQEHPAGDVAGEGAHAA